MGNLYRYEKDIEIYLEERLGVSVDISGLRGSWRYLDPILHLDEIHLTSGNKEIIFLRDLDMRMDSVPSLLRLAPTLADISIGELRLDIIKTEAQGWGVKGLSTSSEKSWLDADKLLDTLLHISYLKLEELAITIFVDGSSHFLDLKGGRSLELVRFKGGYYVNGLLGWASSESKKEGSEIFLGGTFSGDPRNVSDFGSDLYMRLPELELEDFVPASLFKGFQVTRFSLKGDMWLKARGGRTELTGEVSVPGLRVAVDRGVEKPPVMLENTFKLILTEGGGQLALREIKMTFSGDKMNFPDTDIVWEDWAETGMLVGRMAPVDIAKNANYIDLVLSRWADMDPALSRRLKALSPSGLIDDLAIIIRTDEQDPEVRVVGGLDRVTMNADGAFPGVKNFTGYFSVGMEEGVLRLLSRDFTLHIANTFEQPWHFDQARGEIEFSYGPEGFYLSSGLLALEENEMAVNGRLHINATRDPALRTWGLSVGINNGMLETAGRYLPNTLSDNLQKWLNNALVSGDMNESGLLFHGSLGAELPSVNKVYQLYFKAAGTVLNYNDNWPPVTDLQGLAYIHNEGVTAAVSSGRILDSDLTKGIVTVVMGEGQPAKEVLVGASLVGAASDGIRILNETPVNNILNGLAEDWLSDGIIITRGQFVIPLEDALEADNIGLDISVQMKDMRLQMPSYRIDFSKINGSVGYTNKSGLYGSEINARLFGRAVGVAIETSLRRGREELKVGLSGSVGADVLRKWSDQTLLSLADGMIPYKANLKVPFGHNVEDVPSLRVASNLAGVAFNMPAPFYVSSEEKAHFVYEQVFTPNEQLIQIELKNQVRARLLSTEAGVRRGVVHLGSDEFLRMPAEGFQVKGRLDKVDLSQWQATIDSLQKRNPYSTTNEILDRIEFVELRMDLLDVYGFSLKDVNSLARRGSGSWEVRLDNPMLAGDVYVYDDQSVPIRINLEFLHFDVEESEEGNDPLASLNPSEMINVDFSVNRISYGENDYGAWAFRFRPTVYGAEMYDINAQSRGLNVLAGSRLSWKYDNGAHQSHFSGSLLAPQLRTALEQWGVAHSVEGENFRMSADVQWPGSPVMVELKKLLGQIKIRGGKGRFVQVSSGGALKMFG
ncbi:MAG: DUF3971 domain-containing protein, partial [Gammaproteobacteria bacterium]|nr:DUF3971 domain-containing protein [Gammaproteobacteria bacterium]